MSGDKLIFLCTLEESWDRCIELVSITCIIALIYKMLVQCAFTPLWVWGSIFLAARATAPSQSSCCQQAVKGLAGEALCLMHMWAQHHFPSLSLALFPHSDQPLPPFSVEWGAVMSPADWPCALQSAVLFSSQLINVCISVRKDQTELQKLLQFKSECK